MTAETGHHAATGDPGHDLERLVDAVLDGDRRALNQLVVVLRPLVVRYCRARIGRRDPHGVDDVAQEVLIALLKALPTYRDEGRPFLAFVYGIAAHKVVDAHRRRHRLPEPGEADPTVADPRPGPEDVAMDTVRREAVLRLLDLLPPRQREILVLRIVVGLSAEETAEAVGSTPGAVRVAQHRALARMRPHAAVEEEDDRSDWAAAPLTGDPELDELLGSADASLRRLGNPAG
ncbi:RNA polymerase sigma factor ShbA [Actinomycetospora sp. OC33-EN06]|uniref:RNA polymerase sigma factor ShbA n=1 Tax=Actinomycetospora aeridis TaxID=3129231 RepID=A0ABU8N903_9PSEU